MAADCLIILFLGVRVAAPRGIQLVRDVSEMTSLDSGDTGLEVLLGSGAPSAACTESRPTN